MGTRRWVLGALLAMVVGAVPSPAQPPATPVPVGPAGDVAAVPAGTHGAACAAGEGCGPGCQTSWQRHKEHWRDCYLGYPDQFIPRPLGGSLYAFGNTLVSNGEASRMILYHLDFSVGSDRLSPRGRDQLARIIPLLDRNAFPLVIEQTPYHPGLDEARRMAVLHELTRVGVVIPPERIVAAQPVGLGLRGIESELIYQNHLIQTQSGGTRAGLGGGSIGGTVGQGFGATGRPGAP